MPMLAKCLERGAVAEAGVPSATVVEHFDALGDSEPGRARVGLEFG